ncbi:osteocrin [Syngnathus typhle]|uniref:osteocrin n=1 Tax=Syngnathus typhle TaxID=161592 RepID=UPI002A6B2CA3|nr:osteocrin [Syngnathus typhle]
MNTFTQWKRGTGSDVTWEAAHWKDTRTAAIKPDIKSAHGKRQEDLLKMHLCGALLFICLLSINMPEGDAHELRPPQQHEDASTRSGPTALVHPEVTKTLQPDGRAKAENDVTESKRKMSFLGNTLDRLSIGAVNAKHAANRQRVIELPRRRLSLPPMDRLGMRHLPNRRG